MSNAQRYERVSPANKASYDLSIEEVSLERYAERLTMNASQVALDDSETTHTPPVIPNSPPPSFRSHASSRRTSQDNQNEDLNNAFDAPSDSDDDDDNSRSQRRLISGRNSGRASSDSATGRPEVQRTVTEIPIYTPVAPSGRVIGGGNATDGVFANISAKPRPGEDLEEKPPTYEQAAADATPPYWETTVLSPYGHSGNPDDVFVDGLLVGSLFSFVWNALISMSFQLIGFLLTYLLHTTHAAKHGSRAGLGITLIQYGFQMRYASSRGTPDTGPHMDGVPSDPNAHDFDPNTLAGETGSGVSGLTTSDWFSYILMIVGWFILIRAITDFMRARRQEALVRSSPDRGLGTAVVAEGERPETSV